jgi:Putative restriction endonuclease
MPDPSNYTAATPKAADALAVPTHVPIVYEDEDPFDEEEALPLCSTSEILCYGIAAHLAGRHDLQALLHVELHDAVDPAAVVSPDVIVARPNVWLPDDLQAYRVGEHGPAPLLTIEVLSSPIPGQVDVTTQSQIYAPMGVSEYILVDLSGIFMPERQRLCLRRFGADGTWHDERDHDGGVTSALGFRVVIEDDGQVRVIDRVTGHRYLRPDEADRRLGGDLDAQVSWLKEMLPPGDEI